jgi:hypothetical protein
MMRSMVKLMFAMAAVGCSAAANAQTYDVNIDLGFGNSAQVDFSGTVSLNQDGSWGNVDVRAPSGAGAFTAASVSTLSNSLEAVNLYNFEGPSGNLLPISLSFDAGLPVGATSLSVSNVLVGVAGNYFAPSSASVTYAVVPAAAPEIDGRVGIEGMLLLVGGLIVLRSRRTSNVPVLG